MTAAQLLRAREDRARPSLPDAALEYARAGMGVFPLRGKVPLIPGEAGGRGVLDATTDVSVITSWWLAWPWANIGGRVPGPLAVIDVDPRSGGSNSLAELEREHGPLPRTLMTWSGRGDGGTHRWFLRPPGRLTMRRVPRGIDLKTSSGYVVLPPSIHPESGLPYRWDDPTVRPAPMPDWLASLLREMVSPRRPRLLAPAGQSIADEFCASTRWAEVLVGWTLVSGDGDADGSAWRHPGATARISATVRHDLLFVYSTNTPLEPTEAGSPHGYTKFRAWAVLHHGGDLPAAARALRRSA